MKRALVSEYITQRNFFPGDDWAYFKIYSNHLIGERVIHEVIHPLIAKLDINKNRLKWFFIRYDDPNHHIRLRIKSKKTGVIIKHLNELLKPLINQGYIFSVQMDTYRRELERYDINNIVLSEDIFFFDSKACMMFIKQLSENDDENLRWKTAIYSLDAFLDDFDLTLFEKMKLMESLYQTFLPEFVNVNSKQSLKKFKSSVDTKLRSLQSYLDDILRLKNNDSIQEFVSVFNERSLKIKPLVSKIKKNMQTEEKLNNLIKDYLHMNLNRIFPTNARMHELIIYFLMYKTYYSIYNRSRN